MPFDRFRFQRDCVNKTTGKVLNAGCHIDPAVLKDTFGDRVVNMDILTEDAVSHLPIRYDVLHDMLKFPWPFQESEFEMVVLGDILEDLPDDRCQIEILLEARRIADKICITTPNDSRERDQHHLTNITEEKLRYWLDLTGWQIVDFQVVDYGFVPEGYVVYAERKVIT